MTQEIIPSQEIFYPLIALKALLQVVFEYSFNQQIEILAQSLNAIYRIFQCYRQSAYQLLDYLIKIYIAVLRKADHEGTELLFHNLRILCSLLGNEAVH